MFGNLGFPELLIIMVVVLLGSGHLHAEESRGAG